MFREWKAAERGSKWQQKRYFEKIVEIFTTLLKYKVDGMSNNKAIA